MKEDKGGFVCLWEAERERVEEILIQMLPGGSELVCVDGYKEDECIDCKERRV